MESKFNILRVQLLKSASFIAILALWSFLTFGGFIDKLFLPTPTEVLVSIAHLLMSGEFIKGIGMSFFRIFSGFAIAIIISIPLGILIGANRKIEAVSEPLVVLRYVPPSALIPLAILWFGIGEFEKIFIVILAVMPYFTLLISDTVSHTPQEMIDTAKTMGAGTKAILSRVVFPLNSPKIFESIRFMFAVGWAYIIMIEMIGSESGLGHFIIKSQRFLHTADMFAGIIIIAVMGLGVDFIFRLSYKYLFPWVEKVRENG